jgi:uncharacterized protein (TIGR02271 family)
MTSHPEDDRPREERDLVLSEEQLRVGTRSEESGRVRAVKHVDTETVSEQVPRGTERADLEHATALDGDSGEVETLPDGSLSIPVFEEQIVVTKKLVVRERVIVRKHTVYEQHEVTAELRRERLEILTDGDVEITGDVDERPRT